MLLLYNRLYENKNETLGICYFRNENEKLVYCYMLEDAHSEKKIKGHSRIPAGRYSIGLRKEGGKYNKYSNSDNKELASLIKENGIPHILNVPEFEYILIHPGNTSKDTEGCLLPGIQANNFAYETGFIRNSTEAFYFLMSAIIHHKNKGKKIDIMINNMDTIMEKFA